MASLLIRRAGILTTLQDRGRPGWGAFGVPVSGAMDPLAVRAANTLVSNPPDAAVLEVTGPGVALTFALEEPRLVALAGADLGAMIGDGRPLPCGQTAVVTDGDALTFTQRRRGARAILAVAGGLATARAFDSAATDVGNRLGGLEGRPLRAGDRLPLGSSPATRPSRHTRALPEALAGAYADPFQLGFIAAPAMPSALLTSFVATWFVVTPQSNRIGFRLRSDSGAPVTAVAPAADQISEPLAPGTLQLPPDGQPILLMAERQTVGGYPILGHVISADLPKAAQLWPGDRVRFASVTLDDARARLQTQTAALAAWLNRRD